MRTFSLLKGLPIFLRDGRRVGQVGDLCISETGQVTGLILENHKFFRKHVYIALDAVSSFGPDGVMVERLDVEQIPESNLLLNKDALLGRMLFSEIGEELGLLEDVYFSEKMGTIVEYETTDGFFSKNKRIPSSHPPVLGEDAIIVSVSKQ